MFLTSFSVLPALHHSSNGQLSLFISFIGFLYINSLFVRLWLEKEDYLEHLRFILHCLIKKNRIKSFLFNLLRVLTTELESWRERGRPPAVQPVLLAVRGHRAAMFFWHWSHWFQLRCVFVAARPCPVSCK